MATKFTLKNGELHVSSDAGTAVAKWLCLSIIRFFLGRPMNGKTIDNSTFLQGATRIRPGAKRKVLSRWQKKPHLHRALIRGAVFWPIIGLLVLARINGPLALSVIALSSPLLATLAYRKGRLIFFSPFSYTDADTGERTQCWVLQNRWRKLVRMQPVPGLVTRKTRFDETIPHELQEYVRREQAANGTQMPMLGNITRYRRKRNVKEVTE